MTSTEIVAPPATGVIVRDGSSCIARRPTAWTPIFSAMFEPARFLGPWKLTPLNEIITASRPNGSGGTTQRISRGETHAPRTSTLPS